mgnify:CR=1 FL=1
MREEIGNTGCWESEREQDGEGRTYFLFDFAIMIGDSCRSFQRRFCVSVMAGLNTMLENMAFTAPPPACRQGEADREASPSRQTVGRGLCVSSGGEANRWGLAEEQRCRSLRLGRKLLHPGEVDLEVVPKVTLLAA